MYLETESEYVFCFNLGDVVNESGFMPAYYFSSNVLF